MDKFSIKKLVFIIGIISYLIFTSCAQVKPNITAVQEKPNLVVFLVDDMGWGDAACYVRDKNKPFVLSVWVHEPHKPIDTDAVFIEP